MHKLGDLYNEVEYELILPQKEKEDSMENTKIEPITEKPENFESDIFIAAKERKLSTIQYLIEKEVININKQAD